MRYLPPTTSIFSLILILAVAGCSGGSSSTTSGNCVPIPAGNISWTYEDCSTHSNGSTITINPATVGKIPEGAGWAEENVGSRPFGKGNVTFKYTQLDYSSLPWPTAEVILMNFYAQDESHMPRSQVGWHMRAMRMASNGNVITMLRSHRDDDVCVGGKPTGCRKPDEDTDSPLYNGTATYKFDCSWNTSAPSLTNGQGADIVDGLVECKIYNAAGDTLIHTYRVPTSGPYALLDTFIAGGRTGEKFKLQPVYCVMSDFRFTIFK